MNKSTISSNTSLNDLYDSRFRIWHLESSSTIATLDSVPSYYTFGEIIVIFISFAPMHSVYGLQFFLGRTQGQSNRILKIYYRIRYNGSFDGWTELH